MTAALTDKWKKAGASTVTSLAAPGKAIGATSITVGSTTNYPLDTGVVVAIRVVDTAGALVAGTYTEWNAIVTSATSFTLDPIPVYGSDQVYAAGSSTQVYISVSSSAHNQLVDGLLVSHDQDGTLKAGAVDVAAVLAANVVETAKIKDGAVTLPKINGGTTAGVLTTDASGNVSAAGNYSTSEVSTNTTWIDGNVIYKKTINFGALPNNTVKNVAHGITGLAWVVGYDFLSLNPTGGAGGGILFANVDRTTTTFGVVNIDATNISVTTSTDRSGNSQSYITIYYTKA